MRATSDQRQARRARAGASPARAPSSASVGRERLLRAPGRRRGRRRSRRCGSRPSSRATNCSSSSDGASAACRSSRTSTSGRVSAARAQKRGDASNRRKRAPSDSGAGGSARSGRTSRSSGSSWAISGAPRPELRGEVRRVDALARRRAAPAPRPVGRRAARLPAAAPRGRRPAVLGAPSELLGQAALADPRLAGQQEHAAASRESASSRGEQLAELVFPADEDARAACPVRFAPGPRRPAPASWSRIALLEIAQRAGRARGRALDAVASRVRR